MKYVLDHMETILLCMTWAFIVTQFATMAALISIIYNNKQIPSHYAWPLTWDDVAIQVAALLLICSYQWWFTAFGFASCSCCWLILKSAITTYHNEPKQQA